MICGVKILKNFDVLIETDTEASAELFKKHAPGILINLCPSAHIRPRNYVLIFKFVPCMGSFDPYDEDSLWEIESDNGTPTNSISSASWCKRPDLRSPNQQTANLKVCFMTPEGANLFLKEHIRVQGELVNVRMDLRIPTRCNQCQEYGHIRANCINQERCAQWSQLPKYTKVWQLPLLLSVLGPASCQGKSDTFHGNLQGPSVTFSGYYPGHSFTCTGSLLGHILAWYLASPVLQGSI